MDMKERIKSIRIEHSLSQTEFAEKVGVSRNFISLVENGSREASDRTIRDICNAFNINEIWLRTGEGEKTILPEDETAAIVAELLDDNSSEFYRTVVEVVKKYQQLTPTEKKAIDMICEKFIASNEKQS